MKTSTKIIVSLAIIVSCLCIFIVRNPHIPAKIIFSFNQNFKELQISSIDFLVHKGIELDVPTIETGLEQARHRAEDLFGIESTDNVDIFITMPGDRVYNSYLGKENLGIYNAPIKVIAVDGQYTGDLSATIIHEYSHHLFDNYLQAIDVKAEGVPEWLGEGLALTFEYELMDHVLIKYGPMFHSIPFSQLEKIEGVNSSTVYIQGFYGTMYLIENYGELIIHNLMEETATSSFDQAWNKWIDEPYETFHENFFINQGMIRKAEHLQGNDEQLIEHVESLIDQRGKLNVYTPFVSLALIEAYVAIGEHEKAKETFTIYEPFINNPAEFADIATIFKEDASFSKALIDKGLQYAERYDYNVGEYQNYVNTMR